MGTSALTSDTWRSFHFSRARSASYRLNVDGLITRITSVYDGRQVPVERRTALLGATFAS